jgi:hypothetical protein
MSLNHSKYLRTLPSLTRQAATLHSVNVQGQLDSIRSNINVLFDMVEKLLDLYEKDHGSIKYDPITAEIITATDQATTTATTKAKHSPYI